jgi:hypothetical protein
MLSAKLAAKGFLVESEFDRIIDALPGLVWTALPDGDVDYVNQRWCQYTGLGVDEARGAGWRNAVHSDDLPRLLERRQSFFVSGEAGEIEVRLRHRDGDYRWFRVAINSMRDDSGRIIRWIGVNTEIEDRKRAEEAIRSIEHDLRSVIDTIPMTAWSTNADGYCDFCNQRWLNYAGVTSDQVQGWGWQAVIHPEDLDALLQNWRSCLVSGAPVKTEARMRRFDGVYRWFLFLGNPLRDEAGNIVKWFGTNVDIEDRKQAEEDLRTNERNLIQIINTIPTTAWATRPDGYCEFLSDRWLDYAGFTHEEAVGWNWASVIHPDDAAGLQEHWLAALADGTPVNTEARMRRFDGVYRWFLFLAQPLRDESGNISKWFGTNVDIEDRKQAEEELRRSEAFLAEGQRLNLSGSFAWRLDANEVTFSDQLYQIYEFESGAPVTLELIGSRVHPEDRAVVSDQQALARAGQKDLNFEFRLRMPDGSVKYLRTVAHATKDRVGRPEMIGAMQDVTERQLSEEALSTVRSELARMARVATLGALTASIAHEVSQPLSGIITNASTGLRMLGADPPNVDGALETVRRTLRDGNRASDVISKLRALFSHKSSVTEVVHLNEATREVIALLMSELQRNRVVLRSEFADDLPPVIGDRIQLQQVILNLILNASDAMSTIDNQPRRLTVKTERDGDAAVRMTVKDTGIGLDPKTADRLFDAFYTTKSGGMGMGLSVSRSIIESHHGRLWTSPDDGPGATFCFSIPRAPATASSADPPGTTRQSALNHPQSAMRNL